MGSSEPEPYERASSHEFDYSRLSTPSTDKNTARAVVLVLDHQDSIIVSGLAQLIALSAQQVIKPFLVLSATDDIIDTNDVIGTNTDDVIGTNPVITLIADGNKWDEKIFNALGKSGRIDRIDVVTVFSHKLSDPDGKRLALAASNLVHNCRRLSPANAMVFDHRLSVSSYDSLGTACFNGTPDSRLILIPEDRRHPFAMAKPIYDSNPQEFDLHVAAELASICGLWEAADGSALESLKPAASGTGVPLVVLARSFVRLVRLSLPSPEEVLQREEMLPVAVGAMRSPVPESMTEKAARLLHPSKLKSQPPEPGTADPSAEPGFWRGLRRHILSDLRKLPSRLRSRGRSEISAATDEMAEVLLSKTSWGLDPTEAPDGNDKMEDLIPFRELQPVEVLEPQVWDGLVQDILGVADYSNHAKRTREESSGDERHLLVSKQHLAPLFEPDLAGKTDNPEQLAALDELTALAEPEDGLETLYRWLSSDLTPRSVDHAEYPEPEADDSESVDPVSDDPVSEGGAVAGEDNGFYARIRPQSAEGPASEVPLSQDSVPDSQESDSQEPDSQEPDSQEPEVPEAEALSAEESALSEEQPKQESASEPDQEASDLGHGSDHKENVPKSLLQCLTSEFADQKAEAERAYQRCRERISEFAPRWSDRSHIEGEMSAAVPYLLAYGVLLLVLCWTILPRWGFLQADVVENSWWWSRAWIIVTTLLLLALLLLNMPRDTKNRQIYLISGVTVLIGAASWLLLEPQPIMWLLEVNAKWWILLPLLAGLVALIVVCVWLLVGRNNKTSSLKVSAALVLVYVITALVALLNDVNFTKGIGLLADRNYKAIIVVTVVALCLVFAGVVVVSMHYYRQELERKRLLEEFRELEASDENAYRQAERLASVMPHWLGTAMALHRIIRLPYGAPETPTVSGLGEMFGVDAVDADSDAHAAADAGMSSKAAASRAEINSTTDTDTETATVSGSGGEHQSVLTKYVYCEMQPTGQGQEMFGHLLRSGLAQPGWLYAQYRRAAEAYRSSSQSLGDSAVGNQAWPSACAYPYSADEDLPQSINGDRWPFVRRLYAGDFDPILRERLDTFVAGDGLDELFDKIESFRIATGAHPGETAADVLSEIAKSPDPEVPHSMLSDASLGLVSGQPQMQSYLWWPQRLGVPAAAVPQSRTRSLRIDGGVLHQAVRVDLSEPIPLTSVTGAVSSPTSVPHSQESAAVASSYSNETEGADTNWEGPLL